MQRPEDRENMMTARMRRRQWCWSLAGQARVLGSEAREWWKADPLQHEGSGSWRWCTERRLKGKAGE